MNNEYLFTSQRLGFRLWRPDDVAAMAKINADPDVMEFFPATKTLEETEAFIGRMQKQMDENGFCRYAVESLHDGMFIGFIGLAIPSFEASFTPCVDIGWRLGKAHWNKGYASEGATRCMQYGFATLGLEAIYAFAPKINIRSEGVMKRTGMKQVGEFILPLLADDARLRECVIYKMEKAF